MKSVDPSDAPCFTPARARLLAHRARPAPRALIGTTCRSTAQSASVRRQWNMGRCLAVGAMLALCGCVTQTVRVVDATPPEQLVEAVPEELLLDVGVAVFDANVPQDYDEQIKANIHADVRRAEGNYLAFYLKNLLQSTGNWGAVRVVPRTSHAVDVTVEATIKQSDGESLTLHARATDVLGAVWLDQEYQTLASKYAYETAYERTIDPFQGVYTAIADDMVAHLRTLTPEQIQTIRAAAEMRFARDFVPDAFASYITPNDSGGFELRRLPAESDQNLARARRVREREYLFIDTLDEYYETFSGNMFTPYQNWRRATYDEAIAYKRAKQQQRSRAIAGSAAVIGGIATQRTADNAVQYYGGITGIIGGATLLKMALDKRAEAQVSADMLQELGVSAEAAISPYTMELENQVLRLEGSVDAQYRELRRILKVAYYRDLGLALPQAPEGLAAEDTTGEELGTDPCRESDGESLTGTGDDVACEQRPDQTTAGHASRLQ